MQRQRRLLLTVLLCGLLAAGLTSAVSAQDDFSADAEGACVSVHIVVNGVEVVSIDRHCSHGTASASASSSRSGLLFDDDRRLNPIPDAYFWVYGRPYGYEVLWKQGVDQFKLEAMTADMELPDEPLMLSPEGSIVQVYWLPSGQIQVIGPLMGDGKHQEFIHPAPPGGIWRVFQNGVPVFEFHCDPFDGHC